MSEKHRFTAVYEQTEDGWYHVHVAEVPEVQTQGRDLNEARGVALTEQVEVPG